MRAFIYAAALHCEPCGEAIRETLAESAPADPDNESSYDSDEFPKGPYADGGGEADTPQHCDTCGRFLCNPLTGDGERYTRQALAPAIGRATAEAEAWRRDSFAEHVARTIEAAPPGAGRGFSPGAGRGFSPVLAEWAREYAYLIEEPAQAA